jgi:hypothetical protein
MFARVFLVGLWSLAGTQVGIVSWGASCGEALYPEVYASFADHRGVSLQGKVV